MATAMLSARRTRTLLSVGALMALVACAASNVGAQARERPSTAIPAAVVRLPVVDGKDIQFLRFSVDDAPRSRITGVAQDDSGFLWFRTMSGLYKYDGYRPLHYQHEAGDPSSLSADRIWTFYKHRAGTLWIGTDAGLDCLDANQETLTHHRHDVANCGSVSAGAVQAILQDRNGTPWVRTTNAQNALARIVAELERTGPS